MNPILAITAQQFEDGGLAWIKAFGSVANSAIGQFGILGLAWLGVWKSLRAKAEAKEQVEAVKQELGARLDRTDKRVTQVALATAPTNGGTVKIGQPADEPIPVVAVPATAQPAGIGVIPTT